LGRNPEMATTGSLPTGHFEDGHLDELAARHGVTIAEVRLRMARPMASRG
jgi:hypothetical protein